MLLALLASFLSTATVASSSHFMNSGAGFPPDLLKAKSLTGWSCIKLVDTNRIDNQVLNGSTMTKKKRPELHFPAPSLLASLNLLLSPCFFLLYLQSLDALPPLQSRMASNEPLGHYSITQSTAVSHLLLGFSIDGRLSQFLKTLFTRDPCFLHRMY